MRASGLTDYLGHMLEAASLACSYTEGMGKEEFLADKRTQQAVIMNLVIIGEAATKLLKDHADFLELHPEVPWRSMKGVRNRIAHGYFDINLDVVWETLQSALPELIARLPTILDDVTIKTHDDRGVAWVTDSRAAPQKRSPSTAKVPALGSLAPMAEAPKNRSTESSSYFSTISRLEGEKCSDTL